MVNGGDHKSNLTRGWNEMMDAACVCSLFFFFNYKAYSYNTLHATTWTCMCLFVMSCRHLDIFLCLSHRVCAAPGSLPHQVCPAHQCWYPGHLQYPRPRPLCPEHPLREETPHCGPATRSVVALPTFSFDWSCPTDLQRRVGLLRERCFFVFSFLIFWFQLYYYFVENYCRTTANSPYVTMS